MRGIGRLQIMQEFGLASDPGTATHCIIYGLDGKMYDTIVRRARKAMNADENQAVQHWPNATIVAKQQWPNATRTVAYEGETTQSGMYGITRQRTVGDTTFTEIVDDEPHECTGYCAEDGSVHCVVDYFRAIGMPITDEEAMYRNTHDLEGAELVLSGIGSCSFIRCEIAKEIEPKEINGNMYTRAFLTYVKPYIATKPTEELPTFWS